MATLQGTVKSIRFIEKEVDKYGNHLRPVVTLDSGEQIGFGIRKDEDLKVVGSMTGNKTNYVKLKLGDTITAEVEKVTGANGAVYFNGKASQTTLGSGSNVQSITKSKGAKPKQFHTAKSYTDNSARELGPAAGQGLNRAIDIFLQTNSITRVEDYYTENEAILALAQHIAKNSIGLVKVLQQQNLEQEKQSDPVGDFLEAENNQQSMQADEDQESAMPF